MHTTTILTLPVSTISCQTAEVKQPFYAVPLSFPTAYALLPYFPVPISCRTPEVNNVYPGQTKLLLEGVLKVQLGAFFFWTKKNPVPQMWHYAVEGVVIWMRD